MHGGVTGVMECAVGRSHICLWVAMEQTVLLGLDEYVLRAPIPTMSKTGHCCSLRR